MLTNYRFVAILYNFSSKVFEMVLQWWPQFSIKPNILLNLCNLDRNGKVDFIWLLIGTLHKPSHNWVTSNVFSIVSERLEQNIKVFHNYYIGCISRINFGTSFISSLYKCYCMFFQKYGSFMCLSFILILIKTVFLRGLL